MGRYLIWRGNTSGGYNNNAGTLSTYNATYCDWTLVSTDATVPSTFYLLSKRADGILDGSLVIMRSGRFDAYSNALGFSDTYSNLFLLQPIATYDAIAPLTTSASALPRYDLSGRVITTANPPPRHLYPER